MGRQSSLERGSLTIWLVGIMPVLVVVFLFLVNIILMIDAKIRLQAAADRGVYAGAAYLARMMNDTAILNWKFRKEYLDKSEELKSQSEENRNWIESRLAELNRNQQGLYNDMLGISSRGYEEAEEIARSAVLANLADMPQLIAPEYKCLSGCAGEEMFGIEKDDGTETNISSDEVKGNALDPVTYENYKDKANIYLVKDASYVATAGRVSARFKPPFFSMFFGSPYLQAFAAGQPYGGSIREYALTKTSLYHPHLVPFRKVQGGLGAEY